jgi:hypothetical protein
LSKKRDALRRGIRDLLQDTSKDLVAFEGHEVRRHDATSAPLPEVPALNGGPFETAAGHPAEHAGAGAEPGEGDRVEGAPHEPAPHPAPAAFELVADATFLPAASPRGTPPAARQSAPSRTAPKKAKRGRGTTAKKGRRRSAPEEPDDADVVSPMPAESRTGVCRSYFINHECWRVPNAYCNTALQVCVIRNCPVYHLHKDSLERRFAKKFKHFW